MNDVRQRAQDEYVISNLSDTVQEVNAMPIPLPLEIPPPPNLSQLPAHILHSGTVETLLGQNEDLMARLKVNIRRNSLLEQQIMEQDRQAAEFKRAHSSLIAQFQVLQEKDEMLRERSQTFDIQIEELKDQNLVMQARIDAAEERREELHAGLKFERAYRRRVSAWVRPFINKTKVMLEESRTRIAFLDRQLSTREAVIGDLRERFETASFQLQTHQVATNQNQAKLVDGYEARLAQAEAEAHRAKGESSLLREKAKRLDDAVAAQAGAENRIIALERANRDSESHVISFRQEAKAIAAENVTRTQECAHALKATLEAKAELVRSQEQFESLQAVWAEAQKKLETSKLQQDSLNKLNQELSRQLKTVRKSQEAGVVSAAPLNEMNESSAERLGKIDAILVELESGFTKTRDLDFVETNNVAQI